MSVVPASQLVLMRKRKHLRHLIESRQWEQVVSSELELFDEINNAVDDPQRSPKELLSELSSVISLYKEISLLCNQYAKDSAK